MARSELAERIQPALHGLGEAAGTAASDMAEAWREHGAPAASAVVETVREKARERAIPAAAALRDRAVPAAESVRDRAVPAATSVAGTLRDRLAPATESVKGALAPAAATALEKVAPAAESAREASKRAAKKAAKRTKPQRKEAAKRAKSIKAAAKGEKKRRWPFVGIALGALAIGAGIGAAVSVLRKKDEPAPGGYGESLNGAYSSEPASHANEEHVEN